MQFPTPEIFNTLSWEEIQPLIHDLETRKLTPETIAGWLEDYTRLRELIHERQTRIRIATVQDTTDEAAEAAQNDFLKNLFPQINKANNALTEKLLESGLEVKGMEMPLQKMSVEVEIFRDENIPLQAAEQRNSTAFNKISGLQAVDWDGKEYTLTQIAPVYEAADRETRKEMWKLVEGREAQDHAGINELWTGMMELRGKQAANAGYPEDYRAYRWQLLKQLDYRPEDCLTFHDAIEKAVVPAAKRVYEKHRGRLGGETIKPWDLDLYQGTYPVSSDDLRPFEGEAELLSRGAALFHHVDPALGAYFDKMREKDLIDFENRKGKGPGAFCASYEASHLPFIFGNAVGQARDVNTLLHECGHAFHNFETYNLPYYHQRWPNMEFNEVASTAMELLGSPYLTNEHSGYYTPKEAAQARIKHLEKFLLFWPYMAVVDAFQHWVYENHAAATDPANCDAAWAEQWSRFIPSVDWTGWEAAKTRGWHRKRHIHRSPFYYIEYGLAQLGAVQIWANALKDQAGAVKDYRKALSLGGTVSTPELYATAGGKFAFDEGTLREAVDLVERVMGDLQGEVAGKQVAGKQLPIQRTN